MPRHAKQTMTDPLAAFLEQEAAGRYPIPLVSMAMDVEIDSGLAVVTTTRVFRNAEAESIEATLTFPVPVHATLFDLRARMNGRELHASARRRKHARATYEAALDEGKASILHEEVLRGVHMLSVAPIGPGEEIEVVATWTMTLARIGDRWRLRIPLTVGDVYGRTPLPESDAIRTGGPTGAADLTVRCATGTVTLIGRDLVEGRARVPLDAPVDLSLDTGEFTSLSGVAADGRAVRLTVMPASGGDEALNTALLIDHSGSMASPASSVFGETSKHDVLVSGLAEVAPRLRPDDGLDVWEFASRLAHVGRIGAETLATDERPVAVRFRRLLERLSEPRGGTEIGAAIKGVLASSEAPDLLVVTDGQSYALDVHALARLGRRISVVLIGEDSLEANVGHLAALTGGDLLIADEADMNGALRAAFSGLRQYAGALAADGPAGGLRVLRGNAVLSVERGGPAGDLEPTTLSRAVAALAASLRLPSLSRKDAAALAESEGLVTHLTSLVIVDEAGRVRKGLPVTRKIDLPRPAIPDSRNAFRTMQFHRMPASLRLMKDAAVDSAQARIDAEASRRTLPVACRMCGHIPWSSMANQLASGDVSGLEAPLRARILRLAAEEDVATAAGRLDLDPLLLVIALLARYCAPEDRGAARLARAVLGGADEKGVVEIAYKIGLCDAPV